MRISDWSSDVCSSDLIMLGLQNQDLEHHDRVKRRTAALAAIGITQSFDQPDPEILKVHGPFQNLQRIAIAAQHLNMVIQAERDLGSMADRLQWLPAQ